MAGAVVSCPSGEPHPPPNAEACIIAVWWFEAGMDIAGLAVGLTAAAAMNASRLMERTIASVPKTSCLVGSCGGNIYDAGQEAPSMGIQQSMSGRK